MISLFILFPLLKVVNLFHPSYLSESKVRMLHLYGNEICSYRGKPSYENEKFYCDCIVGYKTLSNDKKFLGESIQCSYKQKRRSITLFFALFIPLGIDYLYIERYIVFVIVLILEIAIFVFFLVSFYHISRNDEEKKGNEPGKVENEMEKLSLLSWMLNIFFFLYWFVDIILMGFGIVTDGEGIEIYNDLGLVLRVF